MVVCEEHGSTTNRFIHKVIIDENIYGTVNGIR